MNITPLKYTANSIMAAERQYRGSFMAAVSGLTNQGLPALCDLQLLYVAGGGDAEEFAALVNKDVTAALPEITLAVMEGLNESGFLGKKIDMALVRKEFAKFQKNAQAPSENTGEEEKSTPTK